MSIQFLKNIVIFSLIFSLTNCSSTLVVRPQYINPEDTLKNKFITDLKNYDKCPTVDKVPELLSTAEKYILRMDFKVKKVNDLSSKKH